MNQLAPNLFVLGCAKCGSTTLHDILGQHPDIHANKAKEPTFFNWPFQVITNPIDYFRLFESPRRYRLDSSVIYILNPGTAPLLRSLFPDARFIVSVRHPKRRAYSLYRHMRRFKWEDIPTFAEALKAENDRFTSREFFVSCRFEFWHFQYCRSSLYDEQLARYFGLFDRRQFHVLSLAELSRNPVETTQNILRFLELDPAPALHFQYSIKNEGNYASHDLDDSRTTYDAESNRIMNSAFEGLTERTERLVGHALDWSL